MAALKPFQIVLWLSGLSVLVQAMPSMGHENSILPVGGVVDLGAGNLEIRGVYGGRKKRYIIDKRSNKCCKKPKCRTIFGEIIDENCKCKKCSSGVPSLDGLSCQDKCPDSQESNGQGGCCPAGQKPKSTGDGCEVDSDKDRKGKCPGDSVLDPKDGPQNANTENPKCAIDDEKNCKKPKIPATRPDGMENDATITMDCGEPDEQHRAQCDAKSQYVHVTVDVNGNAKEECRQSRQYKERKKNKPKQLKDRLKQKWVADKPDRDAKEKQRQDNLKKLKAHRDDLERQRQEMEKISNENDKKKARMGKCAPVVALIMGVKEATSVKPYLDKKRDDKESPYDWTTQYFDEDFFSSDDRLNDWPNDIDVNTIGNHGNVSVDNEAWMKYWESFASSKAEELYSCSNSKRSLEARCWQRRSLNHTYEEVTIRSASPTHGLLISDRTDLIVRDPKHLDKRFVQFLLEIAAFATRLAVSLTARTVQVISRWAPRLAELAKNSENLFQVARVGQSVARNGVDGMKAAFSRIIQNPEFRQCVKEGIPEALVT